ncbi:MULTISPECIES: saccharopine dehydrogenase NADP-binding domain-containing protein [unclassified Crossiella]|uniref:saccharopine dehydrogenase NADP-binding domain-containing protein n=1 Tax=unclassified Crossiella TaxID=2620835 RepID=UPI001FFEF496|nr:MULTISPECIES: saccharopine dehydrogenase NADP-binding domain-containing protein [unclassified Crossiella]MCK2244565.1 saccharopine dehydrogenase NADP-binding domain-containing protein [Crossiella sp. S99.2]MCK2258196.1 saccharopine dehydrogenase NADP-binding domain-containing protein [Crossiella sp. S99.1]
MSIDNKLIAVMGAYGHTAKFVLTQLSELGFTPIPVGRDRERLLALGLAQPPLVADVDDPDSLDRAFAGVAAVVNCAGPFIDTAVPVVEAAIRAGAHYVDVAAEQAVTLDLLARFDEPARRAGVAVVPAMAFYGGLGDLLATAAAADWTEADDVQIAIALDSWLPTVGSRRTGARNAGNHVVYVDGRFVPPPSIRSTLNWTFPDPIGEQQLTEMSSADQVTIAHHLRTPRITVHISTGALADIKDPATPPPVPVDELGRSAQTFQMDVVVSRDGEQRRASASGQDIYGVSGPLAAGAVARLLSDAVTPVGAVTAGELFDAREFLRSLEPVHLSRPIGR